jgi:hypothetical protein
MNAREAAQVLRKFAAEMDILVEKGFDDDVFVVTCDAGVWVGDEVERKKVLQRLVRSLGTVKKNYYGSTLAYVKETPGTNGIHIYADRGVVCVRRVKEVVEVPETILPAHKETIYEWDCPQSVLKGHESNSVAQRPDEGGDSGGAGEGETGAGDHAAE